MKITIILSVNLEMLARTLSSFSRRKYCTKTYEKDLSTISTLMAAASAPVGYVAGYINTGDTTTATHIGVLSLLSGAGLPYLVYRGSRLIGFSIGVLVGNYVYTLYNPTPHHWSRLD